MPNRVAASSTLYVLSTLVAYVLASDVSRIAGTAAKCTTASYAGLAASSSSSKFASPASAEYVSPMSVRSTRRSVTAGCPSGTRSALVTWWPCSARWGATCRPALPLPPVKKMRMTPPYPQSPRLMTPGPRAAGQVGSSALQSGAGDALHDVPLEEQEHRDER